MSSIKSKVMTIANRLVKQEFARSIATVKASALRAKLKGTSRRQNTLEKLVNINPADISVKLKREPRNAHDSNAVAVYAALKDNRATLSDIFRKPLRLFTAIRIECVNMQNKTMHVC